MRWHLWVPTVSGPLAQYADGYERWLVARGHATSLAQHRLWQLGQLSAWLEQEGLTVGDLSDGTVGQRFAATQRAAGYRCFVSRLSLRVPLVYLRQIGAVTTVIDVCGPVEELLAEFCTYLARERGLVAGTIKNYERAAARVSRGPGRAERCA